MLEFKRKRSVTASRVISNRIYAKWYLFMGLYCITTYWLLCLLTTVQNGPYMDEIFHVPQLKRYCQGAFHEWDPKITTPPGLYLFTLTLTWPLSRILKNSEICWNVSWVRGTIALSSTFIPVLVASILQLLHGVKDERGATAHMLLAFTSAMFPVLYFFNFLYYTDVLSTLLVLICFWLYLKENLTASSFAGFLSVCVRQTNIMWVFLCAVLAVVRILRQKSNRDFSPDVVKSTKYPALLWTLFMEHSLKNLLSFWELVVIFFKKLWAYALTGVIFILFVWFNESIVLGDKAAHEAVLHFPQILYFCAFTLFFTSPLMLSKWPSFICSVSYYWFLIGSILAFVMIYFCTMAHPYLLADNRHYTFYLWRWVIDRSWWTRYALIPVYVIGALWIRFLLDDTDMIFRLVWGVCTLLCLVPQRLLEFRYFIVPFLLLRLHYARAERRELVLEMLLCTTVNALTIYLYITKKIRWYEMEDDQRIMW